MTNERCATRGRRDGGGGRRRWKRDGRGRGVVRERSRPGPDAGLLLLRHEVVQDRGRRQAIAHQPALEVRWLEAKSKGQLPTRRATAGER